MKKLPIWTIDNFHYVTIKPGFAIHYQEQCTAGKLKCGVPIHTWVKDLPPIDDPIPLTQLKTHGPKKGHGLNLCGLVDAMGLV